MQREARHRERMEQERMRPPSPPPVVHYTEHEAQIISDKIKGEESFAKAVQVRLKINPVKNNCTKKKILRLS